MREIGIIIGLAVLIAGYFWWRRRRFSKKRDYLRRQRISSEESAELVEMFPIWGCLPREIREQTEGWMHVFIEEKFFEPCGEMEQVTRQMKLAVAAPACLLIANRPQDYYERLRSVLMYPSAYGADGQDGAKDVRLGESWGTGSVVLAWKSVLQGDMDPRDGSNVVLHEFAHQLDQADGAADGVPELKKSSDYGIWSEAFAPAYKEFCERVEKGKRTVLDEYAATNPAEFFAVATETFFERSNAMMREEPAVYQELVKFYGMDPSSW